MNGFQPCYREFLSAIIKQAFYDVRLYCGRRAHRDFAKRPGEAARTAIRAMAWLSGIGRARLSARFCCETLGIDYQRLLDRVEQEIGNQRFYVLRCRAIDVYGVTGGVA